MPATFTISDDRNYLISRIHGQHTLTMQWPVATELFSQMAIVGVHRALVDAREQRTPLETMEIYSLWEKLAPCVPHGAKLAMVVGWQIAGPPFIENVAVNRGVSIRYFNDMDEALRWLQG